MGQMKLSSFNREMNMTIDFSDAHNKFDVDSHKCVAFWHSLLCFGKNCRRKDCCRQHLLLLLATSTTMSMTSNTSDASNKYYLWKHNPNFPLI